MWMGLGIIGCYHTAFRCIPQGRQLEGSEAMPLVGGGYTTPFCACGILLTGNAAVDVLGFLLLSVVRTSCAATAFALFCK